MAQNPNPADLRAFLEALNGATNEEEQDDFDFMNQMAMTMALRQILGRLGRIEVVSVMGPIGARGPGLNARHQSEQRAAALRHPNEAYCPDLFRVPDGREIITRVMQSGSYDFNELRRQHPLVPLTTYEELNRFRETPTFFEAVSAPPDLDDVFGEPYSEKDNLYVLAAPEKPDEIIFYSSEELLQTFLSYNDFSDPKDPKKLLTEQQVARLLYLSNQNDDILAETMEQIKVHRTRAVEEARKLFEGNSGELECCLKEMLDAAMYMRGWKGEGSYPLSSMETVGEYDKVKLSEQLVKLRTRLDRCPPLAQLPLMLFAHGRWREGYQLGGNPHLLPRLVEVMNGRVCIRETSNFFASTAWFYLNEFYKKAPFDIERLQEIL